MKFKISNKLFAISLGATALMPSLASCAHVSDSANIVLPVNKSTNEEETHEACTITYIGKNCAADGNAIIARATDCNPKAVHLKLKYFKKDEKANTTVVGKNGLTYKFPEHTYAYISCPMSPQTSDDPLWGNELWENNGINEMGVGVTATLTCASNNTALSYDEFKEEGIGEELLTAIMTPQAATARQAMQIAANAVDRFGNQDANIIMACDQNEAWLMEMYTGHQYCAIKLPDDKVCVAGNEFILDTLADLGINESNKDEMCILSPGLQTLADDNDFAVYKDDIEDIYHLDLFHTYARPITWTDDQGVEHNTDSSHMRTWRGYSLFDKSADSPTKQYVYTQKYAPFLTPKDSEGNIRHDMTPNDVFEVYRDEYDELVEGELVQERFVQAKEAGTLRTIAVQTTRAVHIMSSDKNLPKEISANEWFTPSSGNYTPFLQMNMGMNSVDGEYGYYPDRFDFDENCSSVLFRELNKLAWYDRKNYGYPIQDYWRAFEKIYNTQMTQVVKDASKLKSISDAKNIITNFNKHVRDVYIQAVKDVENDLLWHILDQPSSSHPTFVPLVDLETYVKELGWNKYKFDGKTATFERNGDKCEYKISDGAIYAKGTLKINNTSYELRDSIKGDKVYVDMATLNDAIASRSEIRIINIKDYLKKFNHLAWIIPLVVVVVAGIGVGIYFLVKRKKKAKQVAPTAVQM